MSENGCSENCEEEPPLTEEEEKAVRQSWAIVWKDKKVNGIKIFINLFERYPEAQQKFRDFRGITLEDVKVHKKLRAHALSVIYALKSFIDSLDDPETLVELVRKIARSHVEKAVTEREIKWLLPVFEEVFGELMADDFTEFHKLAWIKLFNIVTNLWKDEQESSTLGNSIS